MGQFKKEVPAMTVKMKLCTGMGKDFRAFGVALVRRMTAATAAVSLACLFTEWLCYVLGRLYSSYVLMT